MRPFEIILILVNLGSLFLLGKQNSRPARRWIAGLNLGTLLLHGLLEGLRYQMSFAYLLVILVAALALLPPRQGARTRLGSILSGLGTGVAVILLGFTALLAYSLPVFSLPKPTGSYAVGVQYFHWIDQNRADPFLDGSDQKRELMVKVYYPAQPDGTKPLMRYFHGSSELIRSFAGFYNLPEFAFDHLQLVKTNSKEGLEVSTQQPSYPVILFSHGAGTTMEVQTAQSEDLASHGYIVVDIDHTYVSAATAFPERLVSHHEATTDFDRPEPAKVITQIMAEDASFVIDTLEQMNTGAMTSSLKGTLDLERIGAIGHSVGGAVAYNLAIDDPRVKAAIDLDGVVYLQPSGGPIAPFLMLANDRYHIQSIQQQVPLMKKFEDMDELDQKITLEIYRSREAYDAAYERAHANVIGLTEVLKSSGNLFTIEGSDHMKFTDIGLFIGLPPLRELLNIRGSTDPARCLEITEALTLTFFDQHLKGAPSTLEALLQNYPDLKRVALP